MTKTELQAMYEVMFTDYPRYCERRPGPIHAEDQPPSGLRADRRRVYPRHENWKRLPRSEDQRDSLRPLGGKSPACGVTRI